MNNQDYYQNTNFGQPMYNQNQFTGYPNGRFRNTSSPSVQAPYYNQFVPTSNKQFVEGLEHALSLPADYNSENVYFDKYQDVMYNICTNGRGEKSYTILDIAIRNKQNATNTVRTPNDVYSAYDERLKKVESQLEVLNGKYNAEQTDTKSE